MATTFVTTNTFGQISSNVDDADVFVAAGVLVGVNDTALLMTASSHDVTIRGDVVSSTGFGVQLGDSVSADSFNRLTIREGASVQGSFGTIILSDDGALTNQGSLSGSSIGAYLSSGAGTMTVVNAGAITGNFAAIYIGVESVGRTTLLNTGSIVGGTYSYFADDNDNANADLIANRGLMSGAVQLADGNDVLDNRGGEVLGAVILGDGADRLDNRNGSITGSIAGGAGDDTFLPGWDDESFDGGAGFDTIDFGAYAGLRVSLLDASGTGAAAGDRFVNVERVLGSRGGADALIGNNLGNTLFGFGGADTLVGNNGADILVGGEGADRLAGGLGNDVFQLNAPGDGGDLILDWGRAAGDDDGFRVVAANFGAGLAAGGALAASRFHAGADNLAQDADDRFVFRTTDATLWFDSNGSGAGGLTLLADLQAGAVVTAGDIVLV